MTRKICILDDDAALLSSIAGELQGGYEVVVVETVSGFRSQYAPGVFDLVVLDMRLEGGKEGLDVLREIQRTDPYQAVVVATAYADTETYLEALQAGALLYLDKTRHTPAALALLFDAIVQQGRLRRDQAATMRALERSDPLDLIGFSDPIRRLRKDIEKVGRRLEIPIVITGEPGSGRELVARNLHSLSQNGSARPLCRLSAAQLPLNDLIRYLTGAETGTNRQRGLLEEAHGGGLVVHRADQLPVEAIKLIVAAWKDKAFRPVGGVVLQPFDAALFLLCEDSRSLRSCLSSVRCAWIDVPSLRDRKEDIPLLASYFLDSMRRRGHDGADVMAAKAGQALLSHAWPGNVAELKSALEYASIRAAGEGESAIAPHHLPAGVATLDEMNDGGVEKWDLDYREARAQVGLVETAIQELATTNKTRLADFLHVPTPTTLSRRIERSLRKYPSLVRNFPRAADAFGNESLNTGV